MKSTSHQRSAAPGQVRITGGIYKRTPLPVNHLPGLRPTPSRVRETLFNWLGQDLSGWHCVDAFAGTGVLGLEAASRGATQVLLCEQNARLIAQLKAVQTKLQAHMVHIEQGDGVMCLQRLAPGSTQLILLDPPFEAALFEPALQAAARAIASTGTIYLEAPRAWKDAELTHLGLQVHRSARAGMVYFHLLIKSKAPLKIAKSVSGRAEERICTGVQRAPQA